MKKIMLVVFVTIFASFLGFAAGKADNTASTQAKKTVLFGEGNNKVEVPFKPKRVAVIEFSALDIIDQLGEGSSVVGVVKKVPVKHLVKYINDDKIVNLGSPKEIDMEALVEQEPDLIVIGSRMAKKFAEFSKIAPTILVKVDATKGYMASFKENVLGLAAIFGKTKDADKILADFDARLAAIQKVAQGKTALVTIVSKNAINTLGPNSRGSIISNEMGFDNMAKEVDSSHGNQVSVEYLVEKNPDYLFVLDRDTAINAVGSKLAKEVIENDLIKESKAYQNGTIIYLTPDVWYLAEGGIKSTDIMFSDVEKGVLK